MRTRHIRILALASALYATSLVFAKKMRGNCSRPPNRRRFIASSAGDSVTSA